MSITKLREMIRDVRTAMFTTTDLGGLLRSRPLTTLDADVHEATAEELWFFISADSTIVDELERKPQVNLAYASPERQRFVSVSGSAVLSRDRERIRRLWQPSCLAWVPEGVEDPTLILIHVRIDQAEYWDSTGSAMRHLLGMAKAVMTGGPFDPGEHGKLRLPR